VRVWDLASGQCLHVFTGHVSEVTTLAVPADGSWLASACQDRTVRIWDLASGRCTWGARPELNFWPTIWIRTSGGRWHACRAWAAGTPRPCQAQVLCGQGMRTAPPGAQDGSTLPGYSDVSGLLTFLATPQTSSAAPMITASGPGVPVREPVRLARQTVLDGPLPVSSDSPGMQNDL
jgi:WD40 repeat protein